MTDSQAKLKSLLRELFQLDNADLDFGIYRIMNAKRVEIERFLDNDLLPQVKKAFEQYQSSDSIGIKADLDKLIQQLKDAGVDPESAPKVKELRAKLAGGVDVSALESQVFSDLYNFFRRYYSEGDFLSLRRYKEGVYAIPYEGEEVKLYWANHDQYYIKSSEFFRDYTFTIGGGKRVHFLLTQADTEREYSKPSQGNERRFILADRPPTEENGELVIRFEYRADSEKRRQDILTASAVERILSHQELPKWITALATPSATASRPDRTVLAKHLEDYTARNTFDYFVHKDLGTFLRRELDFYIKNEVMHLDDIDSASEASVIQHLSRVKTLRQIAIKIIEFVAQIEDFQKTLWLKKKFVVSTHYCITLDHIPEKLYPSIAANEKQREQWVRHLAIDEIKGDLVAPAYSVPLTLDFLKANNRLPVDTSLFDAAFGDAVLSSIADLDATCSGLLVNSDNFQALQLISSRYRDSVRCVYIDPPYNTDVSAIPYKNNYRHSSWATLMRDRVELLRELLEDYGVLFVSIDKTERQILEAILDWSFGLDNGIEELIWVQNTNDGRSPTYSTNHEYVEVYAKKRAMVEADVRIFREPKPGFAEVSAMVRELNPNYPPVSEIEEALVKLFRTHRKEYRQTVESKRMNWETEKRNDPWKGIYQYKFAEYRDASGKFVPEAQARSSNAAIWVYRESDWTIMASESKQSQTTRDPENPNYRFYSPVHPRTGKPCTMPSRGWKGTQFIDPKHPDRNSFESLLQDHRIAFGDDEKKVPQQKRMLNEVSTNVAKSVIVDYADGEKQTAALFGRTGLFLAPKHTTFVKRFIRQVTDKTGIVLDCFGGSGSTAHAVIEANREDGGERKFVLVEVNQYFDTLIKPRVLKAGYDNKWRKGRPISRDSISQCVKIIRLESYEDTLSNLRLKQNESQQTLLESSQPLREDYTLRYMLDVETKGSPSLLDVDAFVEPFSYKLNVSTGTAGETKPTTVDLVETFNWLLGLRVKTIDTIKGTRVVTGTSPHGEKVLVLWRNVKEMPSQKLDEFFQKQGYNTKDMEFDVIYVNGDNNLENLKKDEDTWKVRLIEDDFKRLMFDVQDV